VRNVKVLAPLLLFGDFEYVGSGILDRTHLRFFGRRQAVALLESAPELEVDEVLELGVEPGRGAHLYDRITLGMLRGFLTSQYLIRARKRT